MKAAKVIEYNGTSLWLIKFRIYRHFIIKMVKEKD